VIGFVSATAWADYTYGQRESQSKMPVTTPKDKGYGEVGRTFQSLFDYAILRYGMDTWEIVG
jgi:hypothetical protein